MAVKINVDDPISFLQDIKTYVDEKKIITWTYDEEGDFTHALNQWKYKAWLHPHTDIIDPKCNVIFGFLGNKQIITTKEIYAIYHGRFVETLLSHFDIQINDIFITSMPDARFDKITTKIM